MQYMKWEVKPQNRKMIACIIALIMSLGMLVNPGSASAKTGSSPPATSFVVNIDDNGEIIPVHTYTMAEMEALSIPYTVYYSSIDSMPAPNITLAKGVTLNALVADANQKYNANITMSPDAMQSIRLFATDDWCSNYTYDYLFGAPRYYYPKLVQTWNARKGITGSGCTDDPVAVEPMFALYSYQARFLTDMNHAMLGPTDEDSTTFRFCFGQTQNEITNNVITNNRFGRWVNRMDIVLPDGPAAPTLTPDSTDNTVGNATEITFTDDQSWRQAISIVRVNDVALDASQYSITEGKITINASVFTEAKDYNVYVKASNYQAATVTQTIQAAVTLEPGDINGDGVVNNVDVVKAVNFALEISTPTAEQFQYADMNGDGIINNVDVVKIVNKALQS